MRVTRDADATDVTASRLRRRPALKGLAAIAVAGAGAAAVRLTTTGNGRVRPDGALELSTHIQQGMDTLEVPVRTAGVRTVGTSRWQSAQLPATPFTMVGFVWSAASPRTPAVQVRTRRRGQWSRWWPLPAAHELAGSTRTSDHTGTELVWVGRSDGIQFEIADVLAPAMKLVLLYPKPLDSDGSIPEVGPAGAELPSTLVAGPAGATARLRPDILTRADWGADERWRDGAPRYNHAFQQVHVHHTASSNDYDRDDVPAMIRGMYRYHTYNLGWSDIAYNFLVDRFGRVWEGRAGGAARRVRGAHTLGFNATSTGVAVIGNFDIIRPGRAVTDAVASVAAWKLSRWDGDPLGTVRVVSEGSDRFASGRTVTLPTIDGHRDTNETACPGGHLYAKLPAIRRRARVLMADAAKTMVKVLEPGAVSGIPEVGQNLKAAPGRFDAPATVTYAWLRSGKAIPGATGRNYLVVAADFGTQLAVQITASADGRFPVTQVIPVSATVVAQPTVRVDATGFQRRARVVVSVLAPTGVTAVPAGDVVVRLGKRQKVRSLVDGAVTVRFRHLRPGLKSITASYGGGAGFKSATGETGVVVER